MRILCIGDSNTYGFDPRSYLGERYPGDIRWTDRLRGHSVINFGINGVTIPEDHSVFVDLIKRKDPDLVIVMLGTNDLLQGAGAKQTARRMESFLISAAEAGKPVLLIAPPVICSGEGVPDEAVITESKELADLYREVAERQGCRFADSGRWGIELTFDGVHFSPAGHDTFAQELEKIL